MKSNNEVLVGGHRVETSLRFHNLPIKRRKTRPQLADHFSTIDLVNHAVDRIRRTLDVASVNRRLHSAGHAVDSGKPITGPVSVKRVAQENGKAIGKKRF